MGPSAAPMGSASPSSSPRLPSPPPFPEVQISPKSPGMNASQGNAMPESENTTRLDQGAMRRIRPGTKAADFAGPPLVPLGELDSPFQLQEHLKALYYHHTRSSDSPNVTKPITRETASKIALPPPNVDRHLWLYELCRLLVMKANIVTVLFFRETPPCSASTCPEMRASEWQYLCAVHEPPKSCCAIDYCCHTLEWAADTLTSTKNFPSRLALGGEMPGAAQGAVRQLTNIMRRVYRIFAHAWFSHREVFWQLENDEGLYMLFKTVCDEYHLIPEENYTVPPEAEGLAAKKEEEPEASSLPSKQGSDVKAAGNDGEDKTTISTGATTRRHKHTPSLGSSVTTIQEGDEDDRGSESATIEEQASMASNVGGASLQQERPGIEAPRTEDSTISENKDAIPVVPEPTAESTKDLQAESAHEPTVTEKELKQEDDEVERPSTAVSDKRGPNSESATTTVKTEEPEETAE